VSSGPFQKKYVPQIMKTRLSRLKPKLRKELEFYVKLMNNQTVDKNLFNRLVKKTKRGFEFTKFGKLISQADSYQPLPIKNRADIRLDILQNVWQQAEKMRKTGRLLKMGEKIICPVLAIHGDYDPHPAQGVKIPLSKTIKHFRFILIKHCGHTPWLEKAACNKFFNVLKKEIHNH
jgi:pimeloyl-ACP methyl ester carboxylesterase